MSFFTPPQKKVTFCLACCIPPTFSIFQQKAYVPNTTEMAVFKKTVSPYGCVECAQTRGLFSYGQCQNPADISDMEKYLAVAIFSRIFLFTGTGKYFSFTYLFDYFDYVQKQK